MQLQGLKQIFTDQAWRWIIGVLGMIAGVLIGHLWPDHYLLSAIEVVTIEEAAISFNARMDTGATISSINAHELEVVGGGNGPQRSDKGKQIRFTVTNSAGKSARLESTIAQVRGIATSDCSELRYHVYLTVVRNGAPYRLLMNLNDRSRSKDKLLLGRNWLRHGFVVDVSKTK